MGNRRESSYWSRVVIIIVLFTQALLADVTGISNVRAYKNSMSIPGGVPTLTLNFSYTNDGNARSFFVTLYLSKDPILSQDDEEAASVQHVPINAIMNSCTIHNLRIPKNSERAGYYYPIVIVKNWDGSEYTGSGPQTYFRGPIDISFAGNQFSEMSASQKIQIHSNDTTDTFTFTDYPAWLALTDSSPTLEGTIPDSLYYAYQWGRADEKVIAKLRTKDGMTVYDTCLLSLKNERRVRWEDRSVYRLHTWADPVEKSGLRALFPHSLGVFEDSVLYINEENIYIYDLRDTSVFYDINSLTPSQQISLEHGNTNRQVGAYPMKLRNDTLFCVDSTDFAVYDMSSSEGPKKLWNTPFKNDVNHIYWLGEDTMFISEISGYYDTAFHKVVYDGSSAPRILESTSHLQVSSIRENGLFHRNYFINMCGHMNNNNGAFLKWYDSISGRMPDTVIYTPRFSHSVSYGDYAYLTGDSLLMIYNHAENDTVPRAEIPCGKRSSKLLVYRNLLFYGSNGKGVEIFDLSDPENPILVSEYESDVNDILIDTVSNTIVLFAGEAFVVMADINALVSNQFPFKLLSVKSAAVSEESSITVADSMITWSGSAGNAPTIHVGAGKNYTTKGTTVTPHRDYNGVLTVPVWISDGSKLSDTLLMTIEVTPVNDAPVIADIENMVIRVGDTLNYSVTVTDPDSDLLEFSVAGAPGVSISDPGVISWLPEKKDVGIHKITVTVSDNSAPPVSTEFTIEVDSEVSVVPSNTRVRTDGIYAVPNPLSPDEDEVRVVLKNTSLTLMEIRVVDPLGNTLFTEHISGSSSEILWNLKNRHGIRISSGAYVVYIKAADQNGFVELYKLMLGVQE